MCERQQRELGQGLELLMVSVLGCVWLPAQEMTSACTAVRSTLNLLSFQNVMPFVVSLCHPLQVAQLQH